MGIIDKGRKLGSIFLICLGIILLFIPVIGIIAGLPLIFIGIIVGRSKLKERAKSDGSHGSSNLLSHVKPITKSKKLLILLIFLSFALFVLGSKPIRLIFAASLIFFFVAYINLKHKEDLISNRHLERHFSQRFGERLFGGGFVFIIAGFLWLWALSYISTMMLSEPMEFISRIGSILVVLAYASPGLVFLNMGFSLIRYSYRYSDSRSDERFRVVKPGSIVISKDSASFKQ